MKTVKLYGYATSPFVRKTGCFLYYKGIEFTHIPVNPVDPKATLAHTQGTQVPVLEIDGEYRRESSHHAHWLDEVFPDKAALCPKPHQTKIEAIDQWISDAYLTSFFRYAIDGEINQQFRFSAWRLAALVSAQTPLTEEVRNNWPKLLREAKFIQDMANHLDMTESHQDMQQRVFSELLEHIAEGPYLGGLEVPTMLDLAIFPQLIWGYMFGLQEQLTAAQHPVMKAWLRRMAQHLPVNPTLTADKMQINTLAEGLD